MRSVLIKRCLAGIACLCFFLSSYAFGLTPDQQRAKEKGIALYNQYKDADRYLRIAAEAGDREAQYYLGQSLRQAGFVTEESYKWFAAAANQGDLYAMVRLAYDGQNFCSLAKDCPVYAKSSTEWIELFKKEAKVRAEKGDAEAMYVLYLGVGDFESLVKSAEAGYPQAQYLLGVRYEEGEGFFFPPWHRQRRVEELYRESAEGGNPHGIDKYIGVLRESGDFVEANSWMIKLAEMGGVDAVFSYGVYSAHAPEKYGIPLDLVKGYGLVYTLLELDGGGDMKRYAKDALKEISQKMTPEQIKKAKQFAKEWKETHPPLSFFPPKLGF